MSTRPPDPDSLRYERYWAPVLAGPAQRLLERVVDAPGVCLDIGAGTGTLTLAAAGRWPRVRIISLDASAGMLSVARGHAAELCPADAQRFDWLAADAAAMPLADGSVDLAVSSFALQVVDDRRAVLAEARRVLRSGGQLAFVTWIADDLSLAADDAFDGVVAELGLGGAAVGFRPARTTDYASLEAPLSSCRRLTAGQSTGRIGVPSRMASRRSEQSARSSADVGLHMTPCAP